MSLGARLIGCSLVAACFCAPAGAVDRGRLALMPLPKQALGPDAAALRLANDSGFDSNTVAARHAGPGTTAADLARGGRITGYALDYALPSAAAGAGAARLLEVKTIAELYRDRPAAVKGLAFWRSVTVARNATEVNGVRVTLSRFPARVGEGAFAFELTYRSAGRPLGYIGDIVFRTGNMLGAVFVTARHEAGLRARTLELAKRLLSRMHRAAAGDGAGRPAAARGNGSSPTKHPATLKI